MAFTKITCSVCGGFGLMDKTQRDEILNVAQDSVIRMYQKLPELCNLIMSVYFQIFPGCRPKNLKSSQLKIKILKNEHSLQVHFQRCCKYIFDVRALHDQIMQL